MKMVGTYIILFLQMANLWANRFDQKKFQNPKFNWMVLGIAVPNFMKKRLLAKIICTVSRIKFKNRTISVLNRIVDETNSLLASSDSES